MEDKEKIQKAISDTKSNILSLLSDRYNLLDLVEMFHEVILKDAEEIENITIYLNTTHDYYDSFQKALQES